MLKRLVVKDFALIENLDLNLTDGLTAITGETGSGKSLVLDSLASVLGGRCNTMNIRTGAKKYQIEAIFDISNKPEAKDWLKEKGFDSENGEVILRKELHSDGKARIQIGGSLAPLQHLREFGQILAEVHRQNDQLFLLDKSKQLGILDNFANLVNLKKCVKENFHTYKAIKKRLDELSKNEEEEKKRIDLLKFQIEEIDNAKLKEGEEENLQREESLLIFGEKASENYNTITYLLEDSEESIFRSFSKVISSAEKISSIHPDFNGKKEELIEIFTRLKEIYMEISDEKDEVFFSEDRLESIQNRLSEIGKLKKKYGKSIPEILEYRKRILSDLENSLTREESISSLNAELMNSCGVLSSQSVKLSQLRREAIANFEHEFQKELSEIGMKDAKLQIVLRWELSPEGEIAEGGKRYIVTEEGLDQIEFYFSANQGEKPRPLRKIASGGEMSRVMLSLKVILEKDNSNKLLIFDEIDSGLGGETASIVAEKLKKISEENQVVLITHLQQIAAVGIDHWKVEKEVQNGRTFTKVTALPNSKRIEELAKMISGENITKGAMEHAKELLKKKAV
ncbi:MAG: DNA repair protein RecN [Leptospiraceae bacterium]|nr:DNA repair protein RecN [Leptospiraceae bacterium]MCK6381719.1 DNA repair protein RecN [Leptospiraceae bacterium]